MCGREWQWQKWSGERYMGIFTSGMIFTHWFSSYSTAFHSCHSVVTLPPLLFPYFLSSLTLPVVSVYERNSAFPLLSSFSLYPLPSSFPSCQIFSYPDGCFLPSLTPFSFPYVFLFTQHLPTQHLSTQHLLPTPHLSTQHLLPT